EHRGVWQERPDVGGSRDRGHRDGWSESMAWGTGARAQEQDVPAAGGQKGPHSEAKQPEEKTTGDRNDTRSGCADGDDVGAGANLRSRLATGATRVPLWRK